MRPGDLQRQLTAYYDLDLPFEVETVLTSDARWRDAVAPAQARRPAEQLLVRQDGEDLDVSLYLDRAVLDALAADDPRHRLHAANLPSLLFALEGVSHFVCLAWHASHARQLSAFDLELQAEIDKFLACAALPSRTDLGALHVRLFDQVRYDDGMDAEERSRYRTANRLAGRYCQALLRQHGERLHDEPVRRHLRRFYRLDRFAKLAMIGD